MRPRSLQLKWQFILAALAMVLPASSSMVVAEPLLEPDVLPILTKNCMGCHGGLKQKGELDLRTLAAMLKGGETGPAIVNGRPEESELWKQIVKDEMPKANEKLSATEKQIIKEWITSGLPTLTQRQSKAIASVLPGSGKHQPQQVSQAIDEQIALKLNSEQVKAAMVCGDEEFLRRVYLDLTGRIPTPAQAMAFLDSQDPEKRAKLIDSLLATPEFGEQFGRTWRDWICPPELPSDMNGGKQPHPEARELGQWLGRCVAAGDAWDKIVRELLTAKGEIKNNPQVIFYGLIGQDAKITPEGSARAVASLFMGVQLQCAQCHDDPYRDWAQNEFWSLAAFFGNVKGDFKKIDESAGDGRITIPSSAFKNAGTKIPVAFLRGEAIPDKEKKGAGRLALVDWLTAKDNPYFARAFANRLWFYFFSRGIVNPVDDFRNLNPPSHPKLLKLLSDEFAASDFDVKHVIRCLCNSQAYQRTSSVPPGSREGDVARLTANFGRASLRVMTADMLFDSLKLAYGDPKLDLRGIDPKDGNAAGESAPVGDAMLEFQRDFCVNEEDPTDFTHGIPQMLTFLNHPRLLAGSKALDEFLKTQPAPSVDRTVEWLYLATLSRRPTQEELTESRNYVTRVKDPHAAFKDVLWMLVNRSEFILVR